MSRFFKRILNVFVSDVVGAVTGVIKGGFGAVYFLRQMLEKAGLDIKGQTIAISGFGTVAWGAATKAPELFATFVGICHPPKPEAASRVRIELRCV